VTAKRPSLTVAIPIATVVLGGGGRIVDKNMDARERLKSIEAHIETHNTDGLENRLRVVEIEAIKQDRIKALWERVGDIDRRLAKVEPQQCTKSN
jgi:hypothetical protein